MTRLAVWLGVVLALVRPAAADGLATGETIAGTLGGNEARAFPLAVAAGEAVLLEAMQDGVDMVLTVDGPAGHFEVDSPNGTHGVEPLLFIAEAGGAHEVRLRALEPTAPAGKFTLRVVYRRPAQRADRDRVQAQTLWARAWALREELKLHEALPLAERALALRERSMPGSAEHIAALSLRGYLRDETADYTGGARDFARALAILEKRHGAESPRPSAPATTSPGCASPRAASRRPSG